MRQPRGKHRAFINRNNDRALRQEISDCSRHPAAHCPLRAISVSVRFTRMLEDRPIPRDPAQPRKRLTQYFFLQPELLFRRNMLVMAAPALLKVRALGL